MGDSTGGAHQKVVVKPGNPELNRAARFTFFACIWFDLIKFSDRIQTWSDLIFLQKLRDSREFSESLIGYISMILQKREPRQEVLC